jgi:hypothetical protein
LKKSKKAGSAPETGYRFVGLVRDAVVGQTFESPNEFRLRTLAPHLGNQRRKDTLALLIWQLWCGA